MSSRTWSFVALETVPRCSRNPSETGAGIVAREDLCAGGGGSPVPPLDRKRLQGDVAAITSGVIHYLGAGRSQKPFREDAPDARSLLASAAGQREWVARLPQAQKAGTFYASKYIPDSALSGNLRIV